MTWVGWLGVGLIVLAAVGLAGGLYHGGWNTAPLVLQLCLLTTGASLIWVGR